jgi:hypothetical protein
MNVDCIRDLTPPVTRIYVNGVAASSGTVDYIQAGSTITLIASDPLIEGFSSGVAFSTFTVAKLNSQGWVTVGGGTYSGPIIASDEGYYTFYYQSVDNAGNWEAQKNRKRRVDGTPPITELQVSGSTSTDAQGSLVISTGSYLSFTSTDPVSNGVASGLKEISFSLNRGTYTIYGTPFTLAPGTHTLSYYGVDNVGNQAEVKTVSLNVPAPITPPATKVSVSLDPKLLNSNSHDRYVSARFRILGWKPASEIDPASVVIARIDGRRLISPIPAIIGSHRKEECCDDEDGGREEGHDKHSQQLFSEGKSGKCGRWRSLTLNFDRKALEKELTAGKWSKIGFEGAFYGAQPFSAEDSIMLLKRGKWW